MPSRLNSAIRTACICAITLAVLFVAYQVTQTLTIAKTSLQTLQTSLVALPPVVQKVSDATDNLSGVIAAERKAQTQQLREGEKVMAAAKTAIVRTDLALTGEHGLLPNATESIQLAALSINSLTKHANQSIDDLTAAGQNSLDASTRLLETAQERIADPKIDSLLGNLDIAALHLGNTSVNLDTFTSHGDHIIGYYDARLTNPKGFLRTLGQGLLSLVVPGADTYLACCKPVAALPPKANNPAR